MRRLLFGIFLFIASCSFAQSIEVSATTDSSNYQIGDHINLRMSITAPRDYQVFFPVLSDSIHESIEILSQSNIDSIKNNSDSRKILQKTIVFAIFEPGQYNFPPMPFWVKKASDTGVTQVLTNAIQINIGMPDVDMQADIKDIRSVWDFPITWEEVAPYVYSFGALLVIIFLAIYFYRKWKRKEPLFLFKPKPVIPPHIEAMSRLKTLHESQLWQNNKVKEYYTELTDILRVYIEKSMKIPAVEMTSVELLDSFDKADSVAIEQKKQLKVIIADVLAIADLVKFAKSQPFIDQHDQCFKLVKEFIDVTKPTEEVKNV